MALLEKIKTDLKDALKGGRQVEVSTLRMMLAAIKNRQIDLKKRDDLSDPEVLEILQGLCKKHKDSIEQFQRGGREDLVKKETEELNVVKTYMPEEIGVDEIDRIVAQKIAELKPAGIKDMGKLMQAVMSVLKGKADGRIVSERVKTALQGTP